MIINSRQRYVTITTDEYVPPSLPSMTWGERFFIALFIGYCIFINPMALVVALAVFVIALSAR